MYEAERMALLIQTAYGQKIIDEFRAQLNNKSKDWLIEQLIEIVLDERIAEELERRNRARVKAETLRSRLARVRELKLDDSRLREYVARYKTYTRESLIADGFLSPKAPAKGLELIPPEFRSDAGKVLLDEVKDVFYGLLFGDASLNVPLVRIEQELLTLTLPRNKLSALDFMKAMTEMTVVGSWQDPDNISTDEGAENIQITVEYGEVEGELIGDGIVATLSVINSLQINEQILYARMVNVEQTTLIE